MKSALLSTDAPPTATCRLAKAKLSLTSSDMPNRIDQAFDRLRASRQKGFVAYITGGDPSLDLTVEIAWALEQAGTDFLEIGVPFSDPLADGLANQLGAQRALQAGTTLRKLLGAVREIRTRSDIPLILYSYLNPVLQYGIEQFEQDAAAVGVDGVLLLDLPPDESFFPSYQTALHRIRLIAPTTSADRIQTIAAVASGFIYYVSREGVTGEQRSLADTIAERVGLIRQTTDLPIAVGFGISTPEQAAQVAHIADAVVVGSAIVRRIGEYGKTPDIARRIREFAQPLAGAVKSVRG
jgi:tryptophan synthase alpha chain